MNVQGNSKKPAEKQQLGRLEKLSRDFSLGGVPMRGSEYAADSNHYRHYPHQRGPPCDDKQNYQNSESGEKNEGWANAPEGQAQWRQPYSRHSSHLTTCRDPMGDEHSMPNFLCREK